MKKRMNRNRNNPLPLYNQKKIRRNEDYEKNVYRFNKKRGHFPLSMLFDLKALPNCGYRKTMGRHHQPWNVKLWYETVWDNGITPDYFQKFRWAK